MDEKAVETLYEGYCRYMKDIKGYATCMSYGEFKEVMTFFELIANGLEKSKKGEVKNE